MSLLHFDLVCMTAEFLRNNPQKYQFSVGTVPQATDANKNYSPASACALAWLGYFAERSYASQRWSKDLLVEAENVALAVLGIQEEDFYQRLNAIEQDPNYPTLPPHPRENRFAAELADVENYTHQDHVAGWAICARCMAHVLHQYAQRYRTELLNAQPPA